MGGSLWWAYFRGAATTDRLRFSVWLGLMGWALQGLLEFGLYIPALAWPAFAFLGWLLGTSRIAMDRTEMHR
jgi:hypothetical protein